MAEYVLVGLRSIVVQGGITKAVLESLLSEEGRPYLTLALGDLTGRLTDD